MSSRPAIAGGSRVTVSNDAISTTVPGGTVILDPASGQYFGLEGVGVRAWELMTEPATLEALVAAITSEYDVDPATCEQDIRRLLGDLAERGLVVIDHAEA